ncbi:MAG: hypothetical protein WCK84_03670 [Bacteroidota bacterium]
MKKFNFLFVIGVLLLSATLIVSSGCKKATEDPTPTPSAPSFVVTSQPNGTDYFFIWCFCSTNDIMLTKVLIKDPFNITYTYTGNQQLWIKDELIAFPDTYPKSSGTWRLTFYGTIVGGSAFVSNAQLTITAKK